jgi:hypothetical protein
MDLHQIGPLDACNRLISRNIHRGINWLARMDVTNGSQSRKGVEHSIVPLACFISIIVV